MTTVCCDEKEDITPNIGRDVMSIVSNETVTNNGKSKLDRYTWISHIHNTLLGQIFKAKDNETNKLVAIKESSLELLEDGLNVEGIETYEDPTKEVQIIRYIKSLPDFEKQYVVDVVDFFENDSILYTVYEYVENKELLDYIIDKTASKSDCKKWFLQLVETVKFLHKYNIAHRDISLENVMIDSNNNIKLIDFGVADVFLKRRIVTNCQVGKFRFMPPENFMYGIEYDVFSGDIYTLGACLYIMFVGTHPYYKPIKTDLNFTSIMNSEWKEFTRIKKRNIPTSVLDLIDKIMKYEKDRCSIEDILTNEWLNECDHSTQKDITIRPEKINDIIIQPEKIDDIVIRPEKINDIVKDDFHSIEEK